MKYQQTTMVEQRTKGKKLGFIIYQIAPNIFTGNKKIIIKDFFIKQDFRSKKIGNTSIKKLIKFLMVSCMSFHLHL